MTQVVRCHST